MSWQIDLLDHDSTRIDDVTSAALNAVVRDLAAGDWVLVVPRANLSVAPADVAGIRVWDGDQIVFAGEVAPVATGAGVDIKTSESGARTVTFQGIDDWVQLVHATTYPDPTIEPGEWLVARDERTGRASTVAAEFVRWNLGDLALPGRSLRMT